jgi:hypothetical protein
MPFYLLEIPTEDIILSLGRVPVVLEECSYFRYLANMLSCGFNVTQHILKKQLINA